MVEYSKKNLLVLASPSGGGKSTIAKHILSKYPKTRFSISATTRNMRPGETEGKEYYFLSKTEFIAKTYTGDLLEFEEIFGNYYGTLKVEVDRLLAEKSVVLFDVDVKGALNIKRIYPENSLLIFIEPPSYEVAAARLRGRKSETEEQIAVRLERFHLEISMKEYFDYVVLNDNLELALSQVDEIVTQEIDLD
jgi:guanylate kinase